MRNTWGYTKGFEWPTFGHDGKVVKEPAPERRLPTETVVDSETFDKLLDESDDDEPVPALAEAFKRRYE